MNTYMNLLAAVTVCGANMPNASDFAHCYAASLPRNPPPFTVPARITGTFTDPETP